MVCDGDGIGACRCGILFVVMMVFMGTILYAVAVVVVMIVVVVMCVWGGGADVAVANVMGDGGGSDGGLCGNVTSVVRCVDVYV